MPWAVNVARGRGWSRTGKRLALVALLLAVLGVGTSACGRYIDTIGLGADVEAFALYGERTVVQRFVAHHAGLVEIAVLLQAAPGSGAVTLHLRGDAEEGELATVSVVPPPSGAPTYHAFALPVQDDVNGKSFLLLLEAPQATAETAVLVPYSTGTSRELDLWLDGDLSSGGYLSFELHYDPIFIIKDLARQASTFGLRASRLLLLSALFYLLPGGALVVWLLREGDWIERTAVALGMSVAVHALLVYATMTGLRLGRAATYGFVAVCAGLIGVRWWLDGRPLPSLRGMWAALKADPAPLALAFVVVLVVGVRVFVVRDLVAPMWGDGYHHTMISQLLVDNGGLFDSWEPYAPLTTFTYHFGFHANVALFHWLSAEPVIQSVIWVGQMVNALAVLALYPLAVRVSGGSRWAGVGAVLVAGTLSPMPMYYVNWSRYTQLAGQVILPVLMWLTWELVVTRAWQWRLVGLITTGCVGLGATHYRVVLIYGAFVIAAAVVLLIPALRAWRSAARSLAQLAVVAVLTLLWFLPWALRTMDARLPDMTQFYLREGNESAFHRGEYNAIGDPFFFVPVSLVAMSALGLACQWWARQIGVTVIVLWVVLLFVLANPYALRLPGSGLVNNFAIFIMLYIAAAVLAGGIAHAARVGRRRASLLGVPCAAALIVVAGGWGAWQTVRVISPDHTMLTSADLEAMLWIRENTPAEARFLVNGFTAYGGGLVVGADGGWWIPLLTGRANTVPPLLYGSELARDPSYVREVRDVLLTLEEEGVTTEGGARTLSEHGVTHVYVGQRNGATGSSGAPLLGLDDLLESEYMTNVYARDGVWIFAVAEG